MSLLGLARAVSAAALLLSAAGLFLDGGTWCILLFDRDAFATSFLVGSPATLVFDRELDFSDNFRTLQFRSIQADGLRLWRYSFHGCRSFLLGCYRLFLYYFCYGSGRFRYCFGNLDRSRCFRDGNLSFDRFFLG